MADRPDYWSQPRFRVPGTQSAIGPDPGICQPPGSTWQHDGSPPVPLGSADILANEVYQPRSLAL